MSGDNREFRSTTLNLYGETNDPSTTKNDDTLLQIKSHEMAGSITSKNVLNVSAPMINLQNTNADGTVSSSVMDVVSDLNAKKARADNIVSAVDLNADGTYKQSDEANYFGGASSVLHAMELLDTQIKANSDNIGDRTSKLQNVSDELDEERTKRESTDASFANVLGLDLSGEAASYTWSSSASWLDATSIKAGVEQVADQTATLQTHESNLQSNFLDGLVESDYSQIASDPFASSNYLSNKKTCVDIASALDSAIKTTDDRVSAILDMSVDSLDTFKEVYDQVINNGDMTSILQRLNELESRFNATFP